MNHDSSNRELETAIFAGGCFWCMEAVFELMPGIQSIEPGYTGGNRQNPSYEEVCSGETNHAEAVRIVFQPSEISFESLLELFFSAHNPTTLNQQGADIGTQYRSAVFYTTHEQKEKTLQYIKQLQTTLRDPIVTEVQPLDQFFPAEKYHHQYFLKNPNARYCQMVIQPKVKKVISQINSDKNS